MAPGQRERLHNGEALHGIDRKCARTNDIADHVNQVSFPHDDRIPGQDGNVALGVVGYIAREGNGNGLVRLIALDVLVLAL